MSILGDLFIKYGTDKGIWGYTEYYERLMEGRRFNVRSVLEVGICGYRDIPNNVVGASLFVWREYFPNAHIYGIDNDGRFIFNDAERITTAQCDAYDARALKETILSFGVPKYDMIVDDAVHDPEPQIKLMNELAPNLIEGGFYYMEDVCPYKMQDGDLHRGIYDHIRGYSGIMAGSTPKPEVLVIGVK
jgi:hypothetical protein